MTGPRVLRISHSAVVGEFRERERLLRERHGYDVHVAVPREWPEGGRLVSAAADPDVPLHVVHIRGPRHPILFWYAARSLRRVLREVQPDLVDLHEEPYSLAAASVLRVVPPEIPVCIYTAQNIHKRYPLPFRLLERRALSRAAAAYPCSTEAGEVLRAKGFAGRLHVVPLGVSVDQRMRPGGDGPCRVGFVGRLVPEKGAEFALEAFARAAASGDAVLDIVGSGPEEERLRTLAARMGLDGRVRFIGAVSQEEALERIGFLDVLVVASVATQRWKEQFGRVAAQAMAAGTPVLAFDSGSLPEVLGGCGVLAREGDVDDLAGKLAALLGNAALRSELGARGRDRAERELSWGRVADGFHRMYREVMTVPRPLRVAFVDHTARMGGAEHALAWLVTHLDRSRIEPTVVLGEEGPLADRLRRAGVDVVVVPLAPALGEARKESLTPLGLVHPLRLARLVRAATTLAGVLRRLEADVVHTNSLKAHLIGGLGGRLAGTQVVWHVRDHLSAPYLPSAAARAMRLAARVLPHRVVAVSESVARSVGRDASVVHQGVPLPELRSDRRDGPLRVGLVGRISPWKGQDVFLAAAARLAREFPDVEFVVAGAPLFGEEAFELELHRQARAAPLAGRVTFLGFQEDVWEVYRDLDIVVHASTLPEPYGNVVVEAMASRRPVVAAAAGGVLELVEDGRTGLLVPPGDVTALAAALAVLLRDPERRAALARAGREDVERRFSPERDAEAVAQVYRELAA